MNTPNNPFIPKGTLLDFQDRRRKQFKLAVFCALSVGVVGLTTMLGVQGCHREKPPEETFGEIVNTNFTMIVDTNVYSAMPTNTAAYNPLAETNTYSASLPVDPFPLTGSSEIKIAKGDTLDAIAKKHGVSPKALQAANPKLDPKRLRIGDKVTIPPATPKAVSMTAPGAVADGNSYTVKPGDSLGKIAKTHHTTVNAIKAANNMTTDRINVGKKLILPTKAEAAPLAPALPVEPVVAPPTAPTFTPSPK
jgi:LysM repeat protein